MTLARDSPGGFSQWWTLFVLGSIFMVGELGHFLLGTVARPMAQELKFGDQACLKKTNVMGYVKSDVCSSHTKEEACVGASIVLGTDEQVHPCHWNYNGLGLSYHILAGPAFMAVYTISAIGWGHLADTKNRVKCLSLSTFFLSMAILITSLTARYWQVFLARMALAVWESSCIPMATGILADLFPAKRRGLAMGLLHWGLYLGYGLSFTIGHYVTEANILGEGWRAAYFVSGLPGFILSFVLFFTAKEPKRIQAVGEQDEGDFPKFLNPEDPKSKNKKEGIFTAFTNPAVIMLIAGACVRHAGGFCWAYNSALYFKTYYPDYDVSSWLTGVSIGGGVASVTIGGWLSDSLVNKMGISARALVLTGSQLLAAPFAFMIFQLNPPTALYFVLASYIAAEMWFGVMFAILVELVPISVRSKAVAVAIFFINNFGGNMPVVIDPLSQRFTYKTAVTILYPGALIISSILFFLCFLVLRGQRMKNNRRNST